MEGYVSLRVKRLFSGPTFEKHWACLDSQSLTFYEKLDLQQQAALNMKSAVSVKDCKILKLRSGEESTKHAIRIASGNNKTLALFDCDDAHVQNVWFHALTKALALPQVIAERLQLAANCCATLEIDTKKEVLSKAVISRAYKKLALRLHPDKGGDVANFNKINQSYTNLMAIQHEVDERKNSRLIEYVVEIEKGGANVGLGLVVTEDPVREQVVVQAVQEGILIRGISEEGGGGILPGDAVVGIDNDDCSHWQFSRVRARLNNFRVPIHATVRLTMERRIPLIPPEQKQADEDDGNASPAGSPVSVSPPGSPVQWIPEQGSDHEEHDIDERGEENAADQSEVVDDIDDGSYFRQMSSQHPVNLPVDGVEAEVDEEDVNIEEKADIDDAGVNTVEKSNLHDISDEADENGDILQQSRNEVSSNKKNGRKRSKIRKLEREEKLKENNVVKSTFDDGNDGEDADGGASGNRRTSRYMEGPPPPPSSRLVSEESAGRSTKPTGEKVVIPGVTITQGGNEEEGEAEEEEEEIQKYGPAHREILRLQLEVESLAASRTRWKERAKALEEYLHLQHEQHARQVNALENCLLLPAQAADRSYGEMIEMKERVNALMSMLQENLATFASVNSTSAVSPAGGRLRSSLKTTTTTTPAVNNASSSTAGPPIPSTLPAESLFFSGIRSAADSALSQESTAAITPTEVGSEDILPATTSSTLPKPNPIQAHPIESARIPTPSTVYEMHCLGRRLLATQEELLASNRKNKELNEIISQLRSILADRRPLGRLQQEPTGNTTNDTNNNTAGGLNDSVNVAATSSVEGAAGSFVKDYLKKKQGRYRSTEGRLENVHNDLMHLLTQANQLGAEYESVPVERDAGNPGKIGENSRNKHRSLDKTDSSANREKPRVEVNAGDIGSDIHDLEHEDTQRHFGPTSGAFSDDDQVGETDDDLDYEDLCA